MSPHQRRQETEVSHEPNDLPPLDWIPGKAAAELVGLSYPTTFNSTREALQLVWDRVTDTLRPYPSEYMTKPLTAEDREAKREFDANNVLVVPEWGGLKLPGQTWDYSRTRCLEWRQSGIDSRLPAVRRKRPTGIRNELVRSS